MWLQLSAFDVAAALADDDGVRALVVEVLRHAGPDEVLAVADLRVGEPAEHGWVRDLAAAGLLAVRLVVQADAQDLVRVRDHRQPGDRRQPMTAGGALGLLDGVERAGGEQRLEVGETALQDRADVDRLVIPHRAP